MLKHKILKLLRQTLNTDKLKLLTPKNPDHGDFAIFAPDPPIPGVNLEKLEKNELFEKVERKGNFINFFVSQELLYEEVNEILKQKDNYGKTQIAGKLINFEFGQPNTHKLPHIGHLFSYIYGEACCRLLEATGQTVFRCNYQGDIGLHVAKCLYRLTSNQSQVTKFKTLEEKVKFLQKCYQEGATLYEKSEKSKKEIDELNVTIYKKSPEIVNLWRETRQWSLDYYKEFEKKLGIVYDKYYFESEVADVGLNLVNKNLNKIFEQSDGAIIFPGKKYGFHNRVFINKFGNPTYEAKDLGLAEQKFKDKSFDIAIITTASEQNEYWKVVIKTIDLVIPELKDKVSHIGYGMINLRAGKMSSRTGEFVSAIDLVKTVKKEVEKIKKNTAETVTMASIKYSFLKSEARKNIAFDIEESISIQGNSGPYLLYTYARAQSVLSKSNPAEAGPKSKQISSRFNRDQISNSEYALLRTFFRFPEVVANTAISYSPHLICTYLYDLAQKFNLFYEKNPILKSEEGSKYFRLKLTATTAQILKNGLHLLGIEVLDHI